MSEEAQVAAAPRELPKLKHPEADISPAQPWQDDVLDRAKIAEKLTDLIRNQGDPFVISIDGQWGTGKTFLLKRWQKDLEGEGFIAIYFNAWEDDFCDDPLLSIIGQLSEQFKEGKFKELAKQVGQIAVQLIKQNLIAVPLKLTGLDLRVDSSKLDGRDLLQEYSNQRKTKDRLKDILTRLSAAVAEETGRPLVFIIDELDRCRPTFAIELLERVKHIFDVPNIVFVFGVNRDELCKSLQSVYGDIDAVVYLRRFFDMEFSLPNTNTSQFCRNIMTKFRLEACFRSLSEAAENRMHSNEFRNLSEVFPALCVCFDLSLRDIDYCVRLLALTARNLSERQYMYPYLLALLIPLKLKKPSMYNQFIQGERRASEVMNFVDEFSTLQTDYPGLDDWLTVTEAYLYASEESSPGLAGGSSAIKQLRLKVQGEDLTHPEFLSNRTQAQRSERAERMLRVIDSEMAPRYGRNMLSHLVGLIDFQKTLRI